MKPAPLHIYGICGNAGAGKDSFAEVFHSYPRFLQYSFAGPVKEVVCAAFGISPYNFKDRDLKESQIDYWGYSPRELAQIIGTEVFREYFGAAHWIKRLKFQLELDFMTKETARVVIADVRFSNEAQWILSIGGSLIHLTRPEATGNVGIPNHPSEEGIDFDSLRYPLGKEASYDLIENIGTLQQLQQKARLYIEHKLATGN